MALSETRFQFYNVLSCCITGMVSLNTVVKTIKILSVDKGQVGDSLRYFLVVRSSKRSEWRAPG